MKIPGIYVEIKGDSTQLARDLTSARQIVTEQAKGMSNALNNALSPRQISTSINALTANLGTLARNAKATGETFDAIGVDMGELRRVAGVTDAEFAKLQTRMLKTSAAKAQERALKNIAKAADLTEKEIRELGRQMGMSGAQMDKVVRAAGLGARGLKQVGTESASASMNVRGLMGNLAMLTGGFLAVDNAARGIFGEFKRGLAAVEDFGVSVAASAAFIGTFSEKAASGDIAGAFEDATKYADQLARKLEMLDAKSIATGKDLRVISETMVQYGVLLDINNAKQVEGFTNIANALSLVTAGQNKDIQMRQEINALMMGQIRATDRLPKLLAAIDPKIKEHLELWRQQGTLIENVGGLLKGFATSTSSLDDLWITVGSTMETIHTRVLRGAFEPAFKDLIGLAKELNASLMDANGNLTPLAVEIQEGIAKGYETAKWLIKDYGKEVVTFIGVAATAKAAQLAFNAAVNANPFMKAALALGILNEALKQYGLDLGSVVKSSREAMDAFRNIGDVLAGNRDFHTGRIISDQEKALKRRINELKASISAGEMVGINLIASVSVDDATVEATKAEIARLEKDLDALINKGPESAKPGSPVPPKVQAPKMRVPNLGDDATGTGGKTDWNAARAAEVGYLKSAEDRKAAIIKASADIQSRLNENAYSRGLLDYKTYLDTRQQLAEQGLRADVEARQKELAEAQKAAGQLSEVTGKDGEVRADKTSKARFEALRKVEEAQQRVIEAEARLTAAQVDGAHDAAMANYENARSYKAIVIEMMEMKGQLVGAAQEQALLDEQSVERLRLVAEATAGIAGAQEALDASRLMSADRIRSAELDEIRRKTEALAGIAEINGEYEQTLELRMRLLEIEIEEARLRGEPDEVIAHLQAQRDEIEKMTTAAGAFAKGWADATADFASEAQRMESLAKDLAQSMHGSFSDFFFDVLEADMKSFMDYFKSFLSSLNRALADYWAKTLISGIGGGASWLSSIVGGAGAAAGAMHTGGIVGLDQPQARIVNPAIFNGAKRYHSGLMPDEYPAILQKGEGVFTQGQMRALGGMLRSGRSDEEKAPQSVAINVPVNVHSEQSKAWSAGLKREIEDTVERYVRRAAG